MDETATFAIRDILASDLRADEPVTHMIQNSSAEQEFSMDANHDALPPSNDPSTGSSSLPQLGRANIDSESNDHDVPAVKLPDDLWAMTDELLDEESRKEQGGAQVEAKKNELEEKPQESVTEESIFIEDDAVTIVASMGVNEQQPSNTTSIDTDSDPVYKLKLANNTSTEQRDENPTTFDNRTPGLGAQVVTRDRHKIEPDAESDAISDSDFEGSSSDDSSDESDDDEYQEDSDQDSDEDADNSSEEKKDEGSKMDDTPSTSAKYNTKDGLVTPSSPGAIYATDKAPSKQRAKNPREYMAIHYRDVEEKGRNGEGLQDLKRKLDEAHGGPFKMLKLRNGRKQRAAKNKITNDQSSKLAAYQNAPEMPAIKATTHKEQMAKMIALAPPDLNTRRTSSQVKDLEEAKKIFGYRKIIAQDGTWRLKGMKTGFQNHQLTATAWMMKRECGGIEPLSGILGDDMGMGKTLVGLGAIQGNPPDKEDSREFCKATLVLVPNLSIARQWMKQIKEHCEEKLASAATIYHPKNEISMTQLSKSSIV